MSKLRLVFKRAVIIATALVLVGMVNSCSAQKTTIRFVGMIYAGQMLDWYQKSVLDKFEKVNPEIKVELEVTPWGEAYSRYIAWIAANKSPELGMGGAKWIVGFYEAGGLESLDEYMSSEFKDTFIQSLLKPCEREGELYGLPTLSSTRGLIYNVGLLEKAGVGNFPSLENIWSWYDFIQAGSKVAQLPGVDGYGYDAKEIDSAIWDYMYWMFSAGGSFVDAEGNWCVNSPENIYALEFMRDMTKKYKITPAYPIATGKKDIWELFCKSKIAMAIDTGELVKKAREEASEINLDIGPVPVAQAPGELAVIDTIYMFKAGEQKEAAWKLVEFLFSNPIHLSFVEKTGLFAVTKDVSKQYPTDPATQKIAALLPRATVYPIKEGWDIVNDGVIKAEQSVLLGEQSPREAMDELQKKLER